jgi:hypothetical protein
LKFKGIVMKKFGLTSAMVSAIVLGQYSTRPAQADPTTLIVALAPVVIPLVVYAVTKDVCVLPVEWGSPRCAQPKKDGTDPKPATPTKTGALPPGLIFPLPAPSLFETSNQPASVTKPVSGTQYVATRE